jgi:hypothetical protein
LTFRGDNFGGALGVEAEERAHYVSRITTLPLDRSEAVARKEQEQRAIVDVIVVQSSEKLLSASLIKTFL